MPVSSDELEYAHSWIGDLETDGEFTARVDRLEGGGSYDSHSQAVDAAIEESIRHRIAVLMLDQPTQMAIAGISIGWASNLTEARKHLHDFMTTKGSGIYGVTVMEREDVR